MCSSLALQGGPLVHPEGMTEIGFQGSRRSVSTKEKVKMCKKVRRAIR